MTTALTRSGSTPRSSPSIPPAHGPLRRALLPLLSPRAIDELEPVVIAIARRALDRLDGHEFLDGATEYAEILPTEVTGHLLGFTAGEGPRFRHWVDALLKVGQADLAVAARASRWASCTC